MLSIRTKRILEISMADRKAAAEISDVIETNSKLIPPIIAPITRLFYTDKNRTDSYTEDGSAEKPFKTIEAALARAEQDSDRASVPYSILLSSGTYAEEINLNGRGFFSVTFVAQGRVAIVPVAGNAVTANTDVSILQDLHFYGVEFGKPLAVTGDGTANQFKNVNFRNCSFAGAADISLTCMNSVAFWDIYCERPMSLSNVGYVYIGGGQIQGLFSMEMNSANTTPSSGVVGYSMFFGLISNDVAFSVAGVGAKWFMAAHNCRIGRSAGIYTIPLNCNVSLYNSLFRGTWTNNGTMVFWNSNVENNVGGTSPTFSSNKSAYVSYTAAVPADWDGTPPSNINAALDRIAKILSPVPV